MKRNVCYFIVTVCLLVTACGSANQIIPTATVQPTPRIAASATSLPTMTSVPIEGPQLLDVGGRKLYMECRGSGSPVVILEAGLGVHSGTWYKVFPEIAKFTRVCLFDRFGLGGSEAGPLPRTSQKMVAELHELLMVAQVPPPYILVGHSFGGLNTRLFASTYPEEISGLVFVDAVHPDLDTRIELLLSQVQVKERRELLEQNTEGITFEDILTSEEQVRAAAPLPPVPVIVIRHGLPFEGGPGWPRDEVETLWEELQNDLATLSPDSKVIVAENSRYRVQEDRADVVIAAIEEVFEKVPK